MLNKDNRKYRKTTICNLETNDQIVVESLLDSGAKFTVVSLQTVMKLKLPFIGKFDMHHSNGMIEKTHVVYGALKIRGKIFSTPMIVSDSIGVHLIIGADFMSKYKMYLKFNVLKNDITLKHFNNRIVWNKNDL